MIKSYSYPVLTNAIGNTISIEYYVIDSLFSWPCIYIQWWMHGWEVTIWIFHYIVEILQCFLIKGKIILVPYANPLSWIQKIHYSTIGKYDRYDGKDRNRNFPWTPLWTWAERIAYALLQLSKDADYVIDLHTSRHSIPFSIVSNTEWYQNIVDLFWLSYTQIIWFNTSHFIWYSASIGKKSICLECGSHDKLDIDNNRFIGDRIISWLEKLQMIDIWNKLESRISSSFIFENVISYYINTWWCVLFHKKIWATFDTWDILYEVFWANLTQKSYYTYAEYSGMVLKTSPTVILSWWDCVMQIIKL